MSIIDYNDACTSLAYDILNSPSGIDVHFADATGAILIDGEAIQSGSVIPDTVFQYIERLMKRYCTFFKTDLYVKGLDFVGNNYYFTLPEIVFFPRYKDDCFMKYDRKRDCCLVLQKALFKNADTSFGYGPADKPADSGGISQELDSFLNTFQRKGGEKQ